MWQAFRGGWAVAGMADEPQIDPWRFATVGLELVGAVALFIAIGYAFDRWQETSPWGMIGGAVLGIVGGLYKMIRDVLRVNRSMRRPGPKD